MATLLQQKNCMKSLTNGGGGGNGSNAGQGTRVLLPHEMVSIPISPMTTSGSTLSTGVSTVQHHHSQTLHQQHHHHQQQQQQQPNQFTNYNFYNSIHSNSDSANIFRQPSTSTINLQHPHHISHNPDLSTLTSSVPFMNQSDHSDHSNNATTSCSDINGDEIKTEVKIEEDVTESSEQNLIQQMDEDEQEPEPEIDIVINNVVCSFSVRCHLNLREIALNGINVEFRRENGMVTMKLRRPYTTASIWSSGRITCTGATSEDQAKVAARRYARCLQKLGFSVRFNNFRVVNVLGTCSMPWAIKIVNFSEKYKNEASYEPELHPGVTYKLKFPKATLKIFSTGSITVTASSVANVQAAIEHIFPLVYEFRKKRTVVEQKEKHVSASAKRKHTFGHASNDPIDDNMYVSESDEFDDDEDVENI
ncbi:hypothetical protein HA402_002092 [Bradysia odoriphaga]|nr:hypothetical protein HA402_002092 [Bradysia odoriphaga]